MSHYVYAEQASKGITKAVPTLDQNGLVRKWVVEVNYTLNGYTSTFEEEILAGRFTPKPVNEFTKSELMSMCPYVRWNMIFDSQYQSVVLPPPVEESKDATFDVHSLAD